MPHPFAPVLDLFVPAGLSPGASAGLVLVSLFTSAISAAFGIGGGTALLTIMAQFVPVAALVPVHAVVQAGSNFGRAGLLVRYVDRAAIASFVPGALLGSLIGGAVVVQLPGPVLRLAIGMFVLWSVWGRVQLPLRARAAGIFAGGALSSVLTMFVGATGTFVIALFRQAGLEKQALVGTTATGMVVQHVLKIAVFGLLGFAFWPWLPLLAAMIAAGLVGTYVGARILKRLPERAFQLALKALLTVLAAELIVGAIAGFLRHAFA